MGSPDVTPEMERELKKLFPGRRVKTADELSVTRDPVGKQLVVMVKTPQLVYCYHVPDHEVWPLVWTIVRDYGVRALFNGTWRRWFGK